VMPLMIRPTGLSSSIDQHLMDYTVYSREWPIGRICEERGAREAPARTWTRWFHDRVQSKADVEFCRGRFKFGEPKLAHEFPSLLAVYSPKRPSMTCARCSNGFIGRSNARACSNTCRQALYRQRYGSSVMQEAAYY
jgi:hypothetical protein